MANLKEVKDRIGSVQSTIQITSAMKMVSASKLKRAQDAIVQMRPFAEKLQEILSNLSASLDTSEGVYSQQREEKNVLLIPVSSNRGLCGAFNSNVIKATNVLLKQNNNVSVVSIGKKANDYFAKTPNQYKGTTIPANLNELFDELTFNNVATVVEAIMKTFVDGDFDKIVVVYNKFKNAAMQEVTAEQLLPVLPPKVTENKNSTDYIFEPNKKDIVEDLIPKSLKTQLFKALLDSFASEHGARMTAMHKATDNATEMVKELKLQYNKARQAAITNEILEIVGGAEALAG